MKALFDQAVSLHGQGRLAEAERLYKQMLAADPNLMDARHMLGVLKAQQGHPREAHDLIAAVVAANPRDALALANFGNVLNELERFEQALSAYDRSLALNPDYPPAWLFRGNIQQRLLRYGEAVESYNRFLRFDSNNPDAWNNRGLALQHVGRLNEALESYRRAQSLDPAMAQAFLNQGLCHMLMQDFAKGLPLLEWRKQMPDPLEARSYPQPLWTGAQDLRGKTLFAYIEQGFGDTIQYYRYLGLVLERGARVILSVSDKLIALLGSAFPQVELIGWGKVPPAFDFHIPLASIALAVGMELKTVPVADHYLTAEPERVARWKEKLGAHGFRVGIAWQGNQTIPGSEGKSFPVAALEGISRIPGVRLIALQKNAVMVITDSGGIQEETTWLGTPCLTLRENTERPVTVTVGTNMLIGRDWHALRNNASSILRGQWKRGACPPLWDGSASVRIASILQQLSRTAYRQDRDSRLILENSDERAAEYRQSRSGA